MLSRLSQTHYFLRTEALWSELSASFLLCTTRIKRLFELKLVATASLFKTKWNSGGAFILTQNSQCFMQSTRWYSQLGMDAECFLIPYFLWVCEQLHPVIKKQKKGRRRGRVINRETKGARLQKISCFSQKVEDVIGREVCEHQAKVSIKPICDWRF